MIAKYRHDHPQFADNLFLTDGGIETTLIYQDGFELPSFAAFDLLRYDRGRAALRRYFQTHAAVAQDLGVGFVLESATWRASADWGAKLGYDDTALAAANLQFPQLTIIGGCCGTDHRHIRAIGEACVHPRRIRPTCTAMSAVQT